MIRIFLAHANEDKEAVSDLYRRLKEQGFQPWMDKEDLVPGQNWRSEIPKAIKNSDIFLACLSQASIAKKGYVQKEFRLALNNYAEMPVGSVYLLPVRLNDCEIPELRQDEYGVNLSDIHWVNLFQSNGFEQLVRAITYHFPDTPSQVIHDSDPKVIRKIPHAISQTPKPKELNKGTKSLDLGDGVTLELVYIPGGTFLMGAPESEQGSNKSERPQHEVTVPGFWMGKYPVTQAQYKAITDENPSSCEGSTKDHPVETVSWHDASLFCQQVSYQTRENIRLPSEAEWEYACRAGMTSIPYCFGYLLKRKQANFGKAKSSTEQTTTVGKFPPNNFGLHDMHGNVWEWCLDYRHQNYEGAPSDGSAWIEGGDSKYRMLRGGSWYNNPFYCRSAYRGWEDPGIRKDRVSLYGFRVVCLPQGS
ncbi:MAG: SUMF1/EgtB/PvdO family nonheme iron enzyme [Leptolyngbya sp. SIO3F4]|nr:SUMF1/EgtB/PvdO family nonheme iron enzyme [Leptolyngbya sp. SIO3F4]